MTQEPMTTPDYIKARAEAEFPIEGIDNQITRNLITSARDGYIKGCKDTMEGSAGVWQLKERPVENKRYLCRDSNNRGDIRFVWKHDIPTSFEWLDPSVPYTPLREGDAVAFHVWVLREGWELQGDGSVTKQTGHDDPEYTGNIYELYAIFKGQQQQPATNYREVCEGLAEAEALELAHNRLGLVATDAGDYEALEAAKQQLDDWKSLNK